MKKTSKKAVIGGSIVILFLIIATVSIITVINSHKDETITTNTQIKDEIKSTTNNIATNSTTISDVSDYKTNVINNTTTTTENLTITTTKVHTTEKTTSKQYKIGDTISFGAIDGQSVTWKILKIDDDSALIITEDIIAYKPYHIKREDVNWENSAIRVWLNQTFYDNAFSNKEKLHIYSDYICTTNYLDASEEFYTTDKIFLLSLEEVNEYFPNENSRSVGDWWLLRTTGMGGSQMYGPVSIDSSGYTMLPEPIYLDEPLGIRPAMNIILPLD